MRKVMSRPAGPMRRANLGSWAGMWLDGLGYQNTRDSLRKHVDEEGKPPSQIATLVLTTKVRRSSSTSRVCGSLILSSQLPQTKILAETGRKLVVCGMRNLVVSKIFCIFVG